MKREKRINMLMGTAFSFAISLGSIGSLLSAMDLTLTDGTGVIIWSLLLCFVFSLCFSREKGGRYLLIGGAAAVFVLLREGTPMLHVESLIHRISNVYDYYYHWGYIQWSEGSLAAVPIDMAVILFMGLCALPVSRAVCRQKSTVPVIFVNLLPLILCMLLSETVPDVGYVLLLIISTVLLVLTHRVRRRNTADGIRLTARLVVPVLLATFLLSCLVPKQDYLGGTNRLQQNLFNWVQMLPFFSDLPVGDQSYDGISMNKLDLTNVKNKSNLKYSVMDVVAERSDTVYLRGQALDIYKGVSWVATAGSNYGNYGWPIESRTQYVNTISVSTHVERPFKYMPYYPGGNNWKDSILQGKISNPEYEKEYSFSQREILSGSYVSGSLSDMPSWTVFYRQLPDATKERLAKLNLTPDTSGNVKTLANWICNYVKNSAKYSTKVEAMPEDETDFAAWFLESGEEGYCVHFATAATVLLRYYGIPARYVSGYTCNTVGNNRVTVYSDSAHAWVEYYDPGIGWLILEPTPGMVWEQVEDSTDPTNTVPVVGTEPTEDTKDTHPVHPTDDSTEDTEDPTEETEEPTENTSAGADITHPTGSAESTESSRNTTPTESGSTNSSETDIETQETVIDSSATTPVGGGDEPSPGVTLVDMQRLWKVLKILGVILLIAGVPAVIWAQYWYRRRRKEQLLHTGPMNRRAIARWRQAWIVARILRILPPRRLEELAEKAKFSQHTMTQEELAEFDAWLEQMEPAVKKRPKLIRFLVDKLFFAIE